MESVFKSKKFEVMRREVVGNDGRKRNIEFVVHPGAVVVLPLLSEDECVMIRNYRPTLDRELWELPAGTLDIAGEAPEAAAHRELEEETGYRAERMEPLCEFYPSPGVMSEKIRAFVARGMTETRQRLEPTEQIVVERMRLTDAVDMVLDGRIMDAKTIITLLRWSWRARVGR